MTRGVAVVSAFWLLACGGVAAEPVLRVDVPAPTADKPQSKLWFAQQTWWAWLPHPLGSEIWRRDEGGWRPVMRVPQNDEPARADVYAEPDMARAVLVGRQSLATAAVRWDSASRSWRLLGKVITWPSSGETETATITRDSAGRWWIAWDEAGIMRIRHSLDPEGERWSEGTVIGKSGDPDDIGVLFSVGDGVGYAWTDQAVDAVFCRFRSDRDPPTQWGPAETVARGGKTADDHLNAALGPDGTIYLVSKNSVDLVSKPQLVLYVRDLRGAWRSHPFAPRTEEYEPTRPIALTGGSPPLLHLLFTLGARRASGRVNHIGLIRTLADSIRLGGDPTLLEPGVSRLNNVTGSKAALPVEAPWLALASDSEGGVYELSLEP